MMRYRKINFIISLLAGMVIFFIQCIGKNANARDDARGSQYAGAKSCVACHRDIMNSYLHTNHYKTSGSVSNDSLKKFVSASNNIVNYADSGMVRVEEKQPGFFQSYITGGKTVRSEKMEIAFGSAEKAQTYAYWKEDQLFQLPLTFFADRQRWSNSPGYPSKIPYFDRVILSRCLECHASFVTKTDFQTGPMQVSEKLQSKSIIYGIDCERCHGPAAEHVQFQQENPTVKQARFITSISSLGRQQRLDMCGSCHSGNDLDIRRSLFAFIPGDSLANFYLPHFGSGTAEPDVHGRQMQLLQSSKCFQNSNMTCNTCHDTHRKEEDKEVFIAKCMDCHQKPQHPLLVKTVGKTCVNCHMPLQVSKLLNFNNGDANKSIPYLLTTHRIAIYRENK